MNKVYEMEVDFQSGDNTTLEGLQVVIRNQEKEIDSLKNKIDVLSTRSKASSSINIDVKPADLENLQNIITRKESEINELKAQVDKLKIALQEKDANFENLVRDSYSQKFVDLEHVAKDLQYENKCLRACLLPLSPQADNSALLEIEIRNNEKLQDEVKDLRKQLEDQNFWKIENSNVYQELRRQYNILEAKNEEKQYMINSLLETEKKLKRVENDMSNLHSKYQQTLHRNNILQSEMGVQIQQYKDMLREAENDNFLLTQKVKESKHVINASAAEKIMHLEERVKQLNEEKQKLQAKLASDKEKLTSILVRLEQSVKYNKKEKTDLHAEIDQLNMKICELQGLNTSLVINLEKCNQTMEGTTNNKIIQLQNELALCKSDKMLLEERLNAFNKQHDDLVSQIKGTAMKQVEFETEVLQLGAKLNKESLINNQLNHQLNEAKDYIASLTEKTKQQTVELDKELTQIKAKNIVLEKERDLVVCENNELTLRVADLQKNATKLLTLCSKLDLVLKENMGLKSELELLKKQFQGKITNTKIIIQQMKSENISLKAQVTDLLKTMKVEDNIDLLVQDRLIEKKSLHEKIQQLEANIQELEIKYKKCQEEFDKQSKYYKDQLELLQIEKNTQIQNLKEEYDNNLVLAKHQYDKDIQFVHGRHNEAILKLQGMHEDGLNDKTQEHEIEIENLRAQKKAYRDALRSKRREVEELRDQMISQQNEHTNKIDEMKKMFEADRKRSTENISRLAKKCWIELEKIQVVNKENQYIKRRAEKEILLAQKRSEFEEIEKKLKSIQIDKIPKNDENDPSITVSSCSK